MANSFYEFFAGSGMCRLGLGAGWQCLLANDNSPAKMRSYVANFGRGDAVLRDVARLTTADLPYVDLGPVDLAWCSFPCKDTSGAGGRAGLDGARSGAFWPFWRLMEGLRAEGRAPKLIVIENPIGLITSHGGKDIDAICDALAREGYRYGAVVIDAGMLVPQSRPRLFVVGVTGDVDIPASLISSSPSKSFHLPGMGKVSFHPQALVKAMRRQTAEPIWWRLTVPPMRNTVLADLIEDEPSGPFPPTGLWHPQAETDRLIAMMTPVNIAKVNEAKRTGEQMFGAFYKRMRPPPGGKDETGGRLQRLEVRFDGVAGCLRVGSTGGSSMQNVMLVTGELVRSRRMSAREVARLMGVPDDYKLPGNYGEAYNLMGDGVVTNVVRHLAERVLEPILEAAGAGLGLAAE